MIAHQPTPGGAATAPSGPAAPARKAQKSAVSTTQKNTLTPGRGGRACILRKFGVSLLPLWTPGKGSTQNLGRNHW